MPGKCLTIILITVNIYLFQETVPDSTQYGLHEGIWYRPTDRFNCTYSVRPVREITALLLTDANLYTSQDQTVVPSAKDTLETVTSTQPFRSHLTNASAVIFHKMGAHSTVTGGCFQDVLIKLRNMNTESVLLYLNMFIMLYFSIPLRCIDLSVCAV